MSTLFIDAPSSVRRPGVYAVEQTPPRVIRGVSNGYIGVIGRFTWGPAFQGVLPQSGDDLIKTFEPPGSPRSSPGYYSIMRRLGAPWFIVGIKGTGNAPATLSVAGTGGNLTGTALYPGALGNRIMLTVAPASDGTPFKRDLTLTLSDPVTGTLKEPYLNAPPGLIDVSRSRLVSALGADANIATWPPNGTYAFQGGSDGAALTPADYQTALDQLALNDDVRVVCADDCGDAIRNAVNANIVLHCTELANRVCFIQGSPSAQWAQVKTDKAQYGLDRVSYCGAWVQVFDDAGNLQTSPLSTFAATLRVNMDVHISVAWRDPKALKYLQSIKGIVAPFSTASPAIQEEATKAGIMLPISLAGGGFGLLHGRTTALTSGQRYEVTRWYKDYLALSIIPALGPYVNGPNSRDENLEIKAVVDNFLAGEKKLGHVIDFSTDIDSVNSDESLANGDFFLALDAQTPGVRERLYLLFNVGETVTVRQALAA